MIHWIIDTALRSRFLVVAAWVVLAGWGYQAMLATPIDAIPDLSENQVIVFTEWSGRSPQEVEDQVTYPLTTSLTGMPRVKAVRSQSAFGFSMVNVIFDDSADVYWARTRVLERLSLIEKALPRGATPTLGPDATGVGQVFWYTLEGPGRDLSELRTLQDWFVRYQLQSVEGVAEVGSIGGFVREYQIDVDPNALASYGLTLRDVVAAVQRSNSNVGAKVLEQAGQEWVVRGIGLVQGAADLERTVVAARAGTPLTLGQVAAVQVGPAFRRGVLDKDGQEVVGGVVVMRYGESASVVISRIKKKIEDISAGLPSGVRLVPFYDRSALIGRATATLRDALIEEILLVTLAHILFLWHFRSILVVTLPLPLAILVSFLLMHLLGITSNIMSLGGIAIAIGVLVDAGIVMTENVIRHAESAADDRTILETTRSAARVVGRPIFFSMAIIILAFVPVFALGGQEGKLFHPLAFTKTFAMVGSTLLAVTLVPVLCTLLVRGPYHAEGRNPVMAGLLRLYRPALAWALDHRKTVLCAAGALFAGALATATTIGKEFMPPLDEGDLLFMPILDPATSLTDATRILRQQDQILRQFPEVAGVTGKAGRAETSTDPAPINMFETLVALKPRPQWRSGMTRERLIRELDSALRIPGVTNIWTQPIINRIDMLTTGIRTQVGVKVFGPDLATLERTAREVARVLAQVPGASDVYPEQLLGAPYLELSVDREAAARYGIAVEDTLDVVEAAVGGRDVTSTIEGRQRFAVRVRYARAFREDVAAIQRALVAGEGGVRVPLGQLVHVAYVRGPAMISSENGLLRAFVLANVRGRDVGGFVDQARRQVAAEVKLPAATFLEWSGQFESELRAERRLRLVVPIVLLVIFVLLYLTYDSAKEAAHVLLAVPFALVGGVFLLKLLGYHFSVAVWVGFIALFGTAVQTGVVMVIYLEEAVHRHAPTTREGLRAAVMEGAVLRLRPKVMTVSTVVAGLLPLFWTSRTGSEVMKPLATPVLGGMLSSLVHVLIVTPVIFVTLRERRLVASARDSMENRPS